VHIVTTYLNDPCDLLDDRALCNTLRRTMRLGLGQTPTGVPGVTHRPHGCGCSAEPSPTDMVSMLLAALLAVGALRPLGRGRRAEARA